MTDLVPLLAPNEPSPFSRPRGLTVAQRVMRRTAAMPDGCWLWRGATNIKGYGHVRDTKNGPLLSVHRVMYEAIHGPIPAGLEIDHLCFQRACCNPAHLEAVDRKTNVNRGRHNQFYGVTHCVHGHPFDGDNVKINTNGHRSCRRCARDRMRVYRARKAAA